MKKVWSDRVLCPLYNEILFFTSLNIFLWYDFTPNRKDVFFARADTDFPVSSVLEKGCN